MKINLSHLEDFVASIPHDIRMFFIGLGKVAPLLGNAAETGAVLAGAPEVLPLAGAATLAAEQLGNLAQSQETASSTLTTTNTTTTVQ